MAEAATQFDLRVEAREDGRGLTRWRLLGYGTALMAAAGAVALLGLDRIHTLTDQLAIVVGVVGAITLTLWTARLFGPFYDTLEILPEGIAISGRRFQRHRRLYRWNEPKLTFRLNSFRPPGWKRRPTPPTSYRVDFQAASVLRNASVNLSEPAFWELVRALPVHGVPLEKFDFDDQYGVSHLYVGPRPAR
jgi:hypothetical protein